MCIKRPRVLIGGGGGGGGLGGQIPPNIYVKIFSCGDVQTLDVQALSKLYIITRRVTLSVYSTHSSEIYNTNSLRLKNSQNSLNFSAGISVIRLCDNI
jgi:hypothetical protein